MIRYLFLKIINSIFAAFVVGGLATTILLLSAWRFILVQENQTFGFESGIVKEAVLKSVNASEAVAQSIQAFFHSSSTIDEDQFYVFSQEILSRYNFIRSVTYYPRINAKQRNEFEQEQRDFGYPVFRIFELDYRGKKTSVNRPYYFPLLYREPFLVEETGLIGLDILTRSEFSRVLQEAILKNKPTPSALVKLKQKKGHIYELFVPLYEGKHPPISRGNRLKQVNGLISLTIDPKAIFQQKGILDNELNIRFDVASVAHEYVPEQIFTHDSTSQKMGIPIPFKTFSTLLREQEFQLVVSRNLTLSDIQLGTLFGAIGIGVLFTFGLLLIVSRSRDLKKTNTSLLEAQNELNQVYQQVKNQNITLQEVNHSIGRFVPVDFLDFLDKKSITDVQLGDFTEKTMSILFSDLRSFTSISEGMTPEENFKFLNQYLSQMGPLIRKNHGFIDKYIGDAIMALFAEDADHAVIAGVEMLHNLNEYNEFRIKKGLPSIHMGIGIHRGSLILGTIGEQNRMETTVISDTVNLASRLEGMTKIYDVPLLISDTMLKSLKRPNQLSTRVIDCVQAMGTKKPVTIYEVYNASSPEIFEKKSIIQPIFEQGFYCYQIKEFKEAKRFFEKCISIFPEDRVSQIHLKRCNNILHQELAVGWNGIAQLNMK
ncbi:MAG: class 3 adenylate cyclase/CHASE1-domain containing sensor protein [bacterium]|jgi:class 3 adenylate cyclase/CHASE1-domain containing sensor protein